jgi:porphobilinogen synthase
MSFPQSRLRRLRRTPILRRMVRETLCRVEDLIYPLFVISGTGRRQPISSMPGIFHLSPDLLVEEAGRAWEAGVPAVLLFGVPDEKDEQGSPACAADGVVQQGIRALKKAYPELLVITDVCLCAYTTHGHCGILNGREVDNDATCRQLAATALSHVRAGADMVAPSDMMDGRVHAIRRTLDQEGLAMTPIMSYSVKFASAYYGPFREAADSAPQFGDRRSYQMDPANRRETFREAALDVEEGADILMVKPALPYLDILRDLRERCDLPLAVYNVSGEYSMVKAAAAQGWLDEKQVVLENLTAMKRAGADLIITYHAPDAAQWLKDGEC